MKVKAYTIAEVMISMVIISIIALIVFVLFSSFLQQLHVFNTTNEKTATYAFLKNNLKREFYQAEDITSTNKTIDIVLNDGRSIHYDFNNKLVIKKLDRTIDTIPLTIGDARITNNKDQKVTELALTLVLFNEPLTMVLEKEYKNTIVSMR